MLRKLKLIFFVITVAAISLFIFNQWNLFESLPKNYEWNAVQNYLNTYAGDDDLLLFDPSWLVGYAQVHGRMTEYSVVTKKELMRDTFPPTSRLWLISIVRPPRLDAGLEKMGFVKEDAMTIHPLDLLRYQIPSRKVLYEFSGNLQGATVFLDYGEGRTKKAVWKSGAWIFEGNDAWWNQISIHSESFRRKGTRRCIWFHPLEDAVKTLRFDAVTLGSRMDLVGGIIDSGVRLPPGAPVYLTIKIDGELVKRMEFKDTDTTFHRILDTASFAGPNRTVIFTVQTPHQEGRHFCFTPWALQE